MGRLPRLGVIFLALLLAGSLSAWAMGLQQAGAVAAATAFLLAALAGLRWRGQRPGFSRAERQQIFGRWHD